MKRNLLLTNPILLYVLFLLPFPFVLSGQQNYSNFMNASQVLGQPDFTTINETYNQSSLLGATYSAVSSKGVLAVALQQGCGVFIWNSFPTSNGAPADVVVGNTNFTTITNGTSRSIMSTSDGVAFSPDGNRLIVSDAGNNRILIWNSIPTTNGQEADVVIGQPNFTSSTAGTGRQSLNRPSGLYATTDGRLIVTDHNNNRILIWNSIPYENNIPADVVIGQTDFNSSGSGTGLNRVNGPYGVWVSPDGKLVVSDHFNHRVLVFNTIPEINGAAANVVIGRTGEALAQQNRLRSPSGVSLSPDGKLFISDWGNHRVLIFNEIPTTNGANADMVLGQPDFTTNIQFHRWGNADERNMNYPYNVANDINGRLFLSGRYMHRLMIFGDAPTDETDVAISISGVTNSVCEGGQVSFTVTLTNHGNIEATGVIATTALPHLFNYEYHEADGGTYNYVSGYWNVNSLSAGESKSLTIIGNVPNVESGYLTAYANIVALNQLDTNYSNNSDNTTIEISSGVVPQGGNLNGPSDVFVNQTVSYSLDGVENAVDYIWDIKGAASVSGSGNLRDITFGTSPVTIKVFAVSETCTGNVFVLSGFNITEDTTPPVPELDVLPDITSECSVYELTAPTAIDDYAGTITGTHDVELPITDQGKTVVTWTYNDGNGNVSTQQQNVVINDVTAPVPDLADLPDITAECMVTVLTAPTATDNCAGTITGTHDAELPITDQGTTVVTWTYDDGNGNVSTQQQNVVINDVTAPVPDLATLPDITAECMVTELTAPTATDNCAGTITGTHDAELPITDQGTTVVTWTYDDGNGNVSTQQQNVVINGVTAPVPDLAQLPDITAECMVTVLTAPTATDNCAGTITGTHDAELPITAQGTTVITWTYNDGNGNISTQQQNVVIDDVTAPVISQCPEDIEIVVNTSGCSAIVFWTEPVAIDNCSDYIVVSRSHAPGDLFPLGETEVVYTFTDAAENEATCSFMVAVISDLQITPEKEMVQCYGNPSGRISLTVNGGNGSYSFNWNDGEWDESEWTGLFPGTYQVEVIDGYGCLKNSSFAISEPLPINTEVEVEGNVLRALNTNADGYRWFNCNFPEIPIENSDEVEFVALQYGEYAVEITVGSCTVVSECISYFSTFAGEQRVGSMQLLPNPSNGVTTLTTNYNREIISIQIYSQSGSLVREYRGLSESKIEIDISDQSGGVYIIEVLYSDDREVVKMIIR
ncbi:HYR-like domain-containing protein [Natronoflexus pectinivorans]|uniref:Putative secreted protein (Por secretion system target) n=1 Tax=Natronoflexus pectinivorans TaxID=682526 RepID=A0A4R2GRN5_9BACT|nr:HYR domain-containing protein [Natronoflexus pectinivorans]TCO10816.1 putative secreted protein (Por secretion system target) [Natronoflexus pectinivorans]